MKDKWRNYAIKDGKVQGSYIREYCNRKKSRKTRETSDCNSDEQSRKEQAKEQVKEYSCCHGHQFDSEESTHSIMGGHACPHCPVTKYMIPIKRKQMKASEKKSLLKHINKDSKEFKQQLNDDKILKRRIMKSEMGSKKKSN